MRISPASGWYTPARIFIKVDLPAPFSPTSACTSPARADRFTSASTVFPANDLLMPRISSAGPCVVINQMSESFLPLPLGEGRGEGLSASSFAPSPNPSQREGRNRPNRLLLRRDPDGIHRDATERKRQTEVCRTSFLWRLQ